MDRTHDTTLFAIGLTFSSYYFICNIYPGVILLDGHANKRRSIPFRIYFIVGRNTKPMHKRLPSHTYTHTHIHGGPRLYTHPRIMLFTWFVPNLFAIRIYWQMGGMRFFAPFGHRFVNWIARAANGKFMPRVYLVWCVCVCATRHATFRNSGACHLPLNIKFWCISCSFSIWFLHGKCNP